MGSAREAILADRFPAYLQTFFDNYFATSSSSSSSSPSEEETIVYPRWCVDALRSVGVDLLASAEGSQEEQGGKRKRKLVVDGSGAKWEYSNSDGPEGYTYTAAATGKEATA